MSDFPLVMQMDRQRMRNKEWQGEANVCSLYLGRRYATHYKAGKCDKLEHLDLFLLWRNTDFSKTGSEDYKGSDLVFMSIA